MWFLEKSYRDSWGCREFLRHKAFEGMRTFIALEKALACLELANSRPQCGAGGGAISGDVPDSTSKGKYSV